MTSEGIALAARKLADAAHNGMDQAGVEALALMVEELAVHQGRIVRALTAHLTPGVVKLLLDGEDL